MMTNHVSFSLKPRFKLCGMHQIQNSITFLILPSGFYQFEGLEVSKELVYENLGMKLGPGVWHKLPTGELTFVTGDWFCPMRSQICIVMYFND